MNAYVEMLRHEIHAIEVEANVVESAGAKAAAKRLRRGVKAMRALVDEIELVLDDEVVTTAAPKGLL